MIVRHSLTVPFSCEQMYQLVKDVESYPQFLSFCNSGQVEQWHDDGYTATLDFRFGKFSHSFTTRNTENPHSSISLQLVSGPFKKLNGLWKFKPKPNNSCTVELDIDYEFSSKALELAVGSIFKTLPNTMVNSFHKEAIRKFG